MKGVEQFKYYTMWSFVIFMITLVQIPFQIFPKWLVRAILVNSLAVGIGGTILFCINAQKSLDVIKAENEGVLCEKALAKKVTEASIANTIYHTLPMLIAALLLPIFRINIGEGEILWAVVFLVCFFLTWNLIPYNGKTFLDKIKIVYLEPPIWCLSLLPVIWLVFLFVG